jgi:flagellin
MSGIVLSASVRQNLLSLQSTATLLATTQNDLSTGNKVNSALDNPTEFFTAQGLNNRASDINNLLDGIGNGVEILQAANTGITSLQGLVQSAQSIANQVLQSPVGFTTKSNVSTTIAGATASDLRGTTSFTSATANSNVLASGAAGGTTAAVATTTLGSTAAASFVGGSNGTVPVTANAAVNAAANAGTVLHIGNAGATASGGTALSALTDGAGNANGPKIGDEITFANGKTLTFTAAGAAQPDSSGNNFTIGLDQNVTSLLGTIDTINGNTGTGSVASTISAGGAITLNTGLNNDLALTDTGGTTPLEALGLGASAAHTASRTFGGASTQITAATTLFNGNTAFGKAITDGTTLSVNGHTITFKAAFAPPASSLTGGQGVLGNIETDGSGNSTIFIGPSSKSTPATIGDVLSAIDLASGVKTASVTAGVATISTSKGQTASSVTGGIVTLNSSTGADLSVTGSSDFLNSLGLTSATGAGATTITANRTTATGSLGSLITDGSTLNVDGHTITFKNAPTPTAGASNKGVLTGTATQANPAVETDGNGNSTVFLQSGTIQDVLTAVDLATGVQTATLTNNGAILSTATGAAKSTINSSGALVLSTGSAADLSITATGNALSALGLTGPAGTASTFSAARANVPGSLNGQTLTFSSFNGGTAVNVTFGDGTNGTVKSLNDLNNALLGDNLIASIDTTGKLTISASNDFAASTLGSTAAGGVIGGTATSTVNFSAASAPVQDAVAQSTRAGLVTSFNNILNQINATAQDASLNGVNLLNGDNLKLTFDETAKSTLNIQGVTFNEAGLGLSNLTQGTDFLDNSSANKALTALSKASTTLRSEASSLGSNLSIVQIRQDFNKNLINVLQTGASNLTIADSNELAADSQALSTRQSIGVSALALANQSQQSVLQLLR